MRHLSLSYCLFMMLESLILIKSHKRIYKSKPLHGSGRDFQYISKEQGKGWVWEAKAAVVNVFQLWLTWDLLMFCEELVCPAIQIKCMICLSQKKKCMKEVEKVFIFFCAVPVPVKRTLRRMGGPVVSLTMTERRWICKTTLTVHLLL